MARPIEPDLSGSRGGQRFSADPELLKANLVRLGQLDIRDFLLLDVAVLARVAAEITRTPELALAFNNAPDVYRHLRISISDFRLPGENRDCPGLRRPTPGTVPAVSPAATTEPSLHDIESAQGRLVTLFALDLLQAKAPPLYDSLPWHDWDFSIVAKRFKLWQTRFLLAGAGTGVTMCHCRKSAGVFALEPHAPTARYIEAKAALEKVRRFRLLPPSSSSSANPCPSPPIPLPDASVDLAIIGSLQLLETGTWRNPGAAPAVPLSRIAASDAGALLLQFLCPSGFAELLRVSRNVLLVENSPLYPPLDPEPLLAAGFTQSSVQVRAIGPRPCWWRLQK